VTGPTGAQRVVVIGAGPGGYPAAFHAAARGMDVTLVDPAPHAGGVCLQRGCIPSKVLLHVARLRAEVQQAERWGLRYGEPTLDLAALRAWKNDVVGKMSSGLDVLLRAHNVRYVQGRGRFRDAHTVHVSHEQELVAREFDHAIIATGSLPALPPALCVESPRVMDSTAALELPDIPPTLLVIGGGYIGLELGSVYAALGSRVTVVEMTAGLLPGVDRDLVRPLQQRLTPRFAEILLNTRVTQIEDREDGLHVTLSGAEVETVERVFDKALVAVGRRPNAADLGLEQIAAATDDRGFILTDGQCRTAEPSVFAVGDVAGEPMLAHKATAEARVAVEAIAGEPTLWDPAAIPAVVFTDPEIAWCGLTEMQAREREVPVQVVKFPWSASGRAATIGRPDGLTKLILEQGTERILGVGVVGAGAGELIGEATLAVEMGARARDLALTIHAHPTLSETLMEAAELFFGLSPHYRARA